MGIRALVGWLPDDAGRDAVALAARFSASGSTTTQACTVLPQSWPSPSMAKIDAEYRRWLSERGVAAVESARTELAKLGIPTGDPDAFYVSNTAESAGLDEAAKQHGADIVVLGSKHAPHRHFGPGSTTDSLLHSATVPLALAPTGTRESTSPIARINCAYVGTAQSEDALTTAAALAADWSLPLRLVAFAPRASTSYPPFGGYDAEDVVSAHWMEQARKLLSDAETSLSDTHPEVPVSTALGVGNGWEQAVKAVELADDDLLVVGSSRLGPIARVFLGSSASKIIRHTQVPLLVVPRGSSIHPHGPTSEDQ
ncbi:universal stress protein [Rhodococcoides yunnanense]|uniref:universal stress protein n=1 Tax=Rhodococcoides yunnanense TaxID=278209 RepID=UPI000934C7FD|nr:universal stress protein [Rhodococcus yunnanensis]